MEALAGFSHIYRPDDLNNTLLFQGCVLEAASSGGKAGSINALSKEREGGEEPPIARLNWLSRPPDDLLQQ